MAALKPDIRLSPAGLWTAPAAIETPPGALRVADEIVIRRKGLASARPGFASAGSHTEAPTRGLYFDGDVATVDPVEPLTEWLSDGAEILTEEGSDPLSWAADGIEGVEARGSLYITTKDGVRKIVESGDAAAYRTGAPAPVIFALLDTSGTGVAIVGESNYSYRVVTRREIGGIVVRSAPSNRSLVKNAGSTTENAIIRIALHANDDFRAGDILEVYRSLRVPDTVRPFDEHYLAGVHPISASDLSAGYVAFTDLVAEVDLGAELYTNPDMDGAAGAHIRPPACKTLDIFQGSLFLGNLTFKAALQLSVNIAGTSLGNTAAGVGYRQIVSAMTHGSAAVTVGSTTGLEAGMIVFSDSAADWVAGTGYVTIQSIDSATTLTLSRQWDSTTASHIITYVDSIRISQGFTALVHPIGLGGVFLGFSLAGVLTQIPIAFGPMTQAADTLVRSDVLSTEEFIISNGVRVIRLEALNFEEPFSVQATHGEAYDPVLPSHVSTALQFSDNEAPASVMWSKKEQPEHFTLANIEQVGHALARVMALRAVNTALCIFKDDSLFRATGDGAETGFRFDEGDASIRLLYPAAAAVLNSKVYAWTDQGVQECDESGCLNISRPAIYNSLGPVERAVGGGSATASGAFVLANRKDQEVIIGVPAPGALTAASALYVFNILTGAWTRWLVGWDLAWAVYDASAEAVVVSDGGEAFEERPVTSTPWDVDGEWTPSISSFVGTAVVIAGGSGWTPEVGDLIKRSTTLMRVMAVTDPTHFTTDVAPPSTGSATAYEAFTSTVSFIGNFAKNPMAAKVWGEGSLCFDSTQGLWRYGMSVTSSLLESAAVTQTRVFATAPVSETTPEDSAESYRFSVPRAHSRSSRVYPTFTITQGGAEWSISACDLACRVVGQRVRKR